MTCAYDTCPATKITHIKEALCLWSVPSNGTAGKPSVTHLPELLAWTYETVDDSYRQYRRDVMHQLSKKVALACTSVPPLPRSLLLRSNYHYLCACIIRDPLAARLLIRLPCVSCLQHRPSFLQPLAGCYRLTITDITIAGLRPGLNGVKNWQNRYSEIRSFGLRNLTTLTTRIVICEQKPQTNGNALYLLAIGKANPHAKSSKTAHPM